MTTYALTVHPKASPKAIFVEVPKMAPIELDTQLSYVPAVIAGSHPFAVGVVSVIALSSIYRSYKALPPSSATRDREPARKLHAQVFAALALLSLVVAGFYGAQFASLSYRVWAAERGVELPESIFGDKGAIRGGEHPGRLQFSKWLNDTPFYRDALEIVAEKARHFWWGQQVNLGLVSWSLYLAIEGRRRNISKLWAFLALSQLVNLSFAQNLFFAAVLLTPVPLPENVRELTRTSIPTSSRYSNLMAKLFPTKPDGFLPAAGPYAALLTINYTLIFLVPVAVNTPSFTAIAIASRILPFSILALPYLIPETWGTIHPHPHSAHSTYTMLFRTISTLSFLLHAKSTAMALFHNTPNAYYRHSVLHPFKEHRSALDRGSTAFSRVFGAFLEHPAVSYEGWDVILSGLSLGVWAAIRGLDAKEMLQSSIPFLGQPARDAGSTAKGAVAKIESNATPASITRRRRTKKSSEVDKDTTTISEKAKRSARPGNPIKPEDGDATYTPPADSKPVEEGDEEAEEDWEAASLGWGLMSVAGLGVGTAAILGGEVVGR